MFFSTTLLRLNTVFDEGVMPADRTGITIEKYWRSAET